MLWTLPKDMTKVYLSLMNYLSKKVTNRKIENDPNIGI